MKKFLFTLMAVLALPIVLQAQSVDDDLYFVPSKKKTEKKETKVKVETAGPVRVETPTTVVTSNAKSTVVVRDRSKNTRDVDAYNRRYDSKDYTFSSANDTLYIEERPDSDLDGEWVSGFDGSADDYEYATRIIRFRNPRYAVPVSSPLYFDIVYGLNTFDWNVYYDGFYAYAFPTYTNRLWWDWRFNSFGWGWSSPYFSWSFGWGGWYDPFWYGHHHCHWGGWYGPVYHHPHHAAPWGGYRPRGSYTNRTSMAPRYASSTRVGSSRPGITARRTATRGSQTTTRRVSTTTGVRRTDGVTRVQSGGTSQRRVVGTRQSSTSTRSGAVRTGDASSSRRQTYTRPSSTRVTGSSETTQSSVRRTEATDTRVGGTSRTATATRSAGSSVSGSGQRTTYSRGSSSSSTRREQTTVNTRSSQSNSSRGSYSSGSSSRSSYGGGGATRSSGGGGSRGGRR